MSTYQVRSLEEADQIIREHERSSKTYYSLLRSTKNFACIDVPSCINEENEVRFETVGVPYCGVPFFVAGLKILQCQSYRGRGGRKKKEIKIEIYGSGSGVIGNAGVGDAGGDKDDQPGITPLVKKKKFGRVHKVGCTATIIMKEVIYYPQFQLVEHNKNNRIAVARQLKDALKAKSPIQKDRIIYVTVPANSDHFGHTVGLSPQKVTNPTASRRLYVKNDYYGPNEAGSSKRVYYPVKQEKTGQGCTFNNKKIKVDLDAEVDAEERAKDVRELIQSIMGLTYKKPGTGEALRDLYKGLLHCKLKYQQAMGLLYGSNIPPITEPDTNNVPAWNGRAVTNNGTPAPPTNSTPVSTSITVAPTPNNNIVPASTSNNSPPVFQSPSATSPSVFQSPSASTTQVFQSASSTTTVQTNPDGANQETSIFIEAMEAILNSHV